MSRIEDHPVSLAESEAPTTPGEVLRQARGDAGWTLGKLARALDVSVSALSDVERNRAPMFPPETVRLVARILEVNEYALMDAVAARKDQQ